MTHYTHSVFVSAILLSVALLSSPAYAGGDDRDLGPIEVLDIIVETQAKSKASAQPVIDSTQDKTPVVKVVVSEPVAIDQVISAPVQAVEVEAVEVIDTSAAVREVVEDRVVEKVAVIEVAKPVVQQKIAIEAKPIVAQKPASEVEDILTSVTKVVQPAGSAVVEYVQGDVADKPVGAPTAPVEDISPKLYESCEDMLSSSNSLVQNTCVVIMGVFILL